MYLPQMVTLVTFELVAVAMGASDCCGLEWNRSSLKIKGHKDEKALCSNIFDGLKE